MSNPIAKAAVTRENSLWCVRLGDRDYRGYESEEAAVEAAGRLMEGLTTNQESIRLACWGCERKDGDGKTTLGAIDEGWLVIEWAPTSGEDLEEWWTHLGWCPECAKAETKYIEQREAKLARLVLKSFDDDPAPAPPAERESGEPNGETQADKEQSDRILDALGVARHALKSIGFYGGPDPDPPGRVMLPEPTDLARFVRFGPKHHRDAIATLETVAFAVCTLRNPGASVEARENAANRLALLFGGKPAEDEA